MDEKDIEILTLKKQNLELQAQIVQLQMSLIHREHEQITAKLAALQEPIPADA